MSVYAGSVVQWRGSRTGDIYYVLERRRTRCVAISEKSRTVVTLSMDHVEDAPRDWPADAPTTAAEAITYGTVVTLSNPRFLSEHAGLWVCIKPDSQNRSQYAPLDHATGRNVRVKCGHEDVEIRHLTY